MAEHTPDPWQVLDDWCREQSRKLAIRAEPYIPGDLYNPEYRRLLGQIQAFGRVRSFIHGNRRDAPKGGIHDHPE